MVSKAKINRFVANGALDRRKRRQLLAGDFNLFGVVNDVGEPFK